MSMVVVLISTWPVSESSHSAPLATHWLSPFSTALMPLPATEPATLPAWQSGFNASTGHPADGAIGRVGAAATGPLATRSPLAGHDMRHQQKGGEHGGLLYRSRGHGEGERDVRPSELSGP